MSTYSIGHIARQSGISVETIRFYEQKGLIDEPPRKESGYRQYDEQAITRLTFIQQAKELGFSLKEISELLAIKSSTNSNCNHVKQLTQEKLNDIEIKIKMLKRMQGILKKLVDDCPGSGPVGDCPILGSLNSEDKL